MSYMICKQVFHRIPSFCTEKERVKTGKSDYPSPDERLFFQAHTYLFRRKNKVVESSIVRVFFFQIMSEIQKMTKNQEIRRTYTFVDI